MSMFRSIWWTYFVLPNFVIALEGRYQRWLSTPAAVETDDTLRDNLTLATGIRTPISIHGAVKTLPAVSFGMGFRGPVSDRGYHIVQLDLPVAF